MTPASVYFLGEEPRGSFQDFVGWVLVHNGLPLLPCSPFTIMESKEKNSALAAVTTSVSEQPEPTTDAELEPAKITALTRTEPYIVPEPDISFNQVCEPATTSVTKGLLVVYEGVKCSPAPSTTADKI